MRVKFMKLTDNDLFRILRFITFKKRKNVISHNRRLNYIALDNNKNLLCRKNNLNTLMGLVNKIRCFNQF